MLYIELNPVSFLLALASAHIGYILIAWLIHFIFHQQILGIPFWKVHLNSHHSTEKMSAFRFYCWGILEHGTSALFLCAYCLSCYLLLCNWLASIFIMSIIINTSITYYLHDQYAISKSWLNRYDWFKRDRKMHQIHHSYLGDHFADSKNYSFGGLMGYVMDRSVGTFEPVKSANNLLQE